MLTHLHTFIIINKIQTWNNPSKLLIMTKYVEYGQGGAGPKWEQFRSAQVQLAPRTVKLGAGPFRSNWSNWEREIIYLTTHSTLFMASDIWLRTILIVRKETRCRYIGYSYRLTARVLLYAPSHRQDNTYHGLCYTSRGALAGTRNSSMGGPISLRPALSMNGQQPAW